ncbi:MAG: SMC family ATPase [Coriobacteriia bacterium]|nr:SMC family ATPase [Coriobacteriia bacterium]
MRPTHLTVQDFGSFGTLDLDLTPLSLVAVVGENGAGKSTLLTAMLVALYGTAVAPLDGFVRQGAQGFKLTLDFTVSDVTYRVVREYGKAQKVSFSRDGVPLAIDKVREVDAAIVAAVGYDFASFTVSHWLRQGDLGRFAGFDPAARKEWLIAALGLHVWPKMEAEAKRRLSDKRTEVAAAQATVDALEEGDADEVRAALVGLTDGAEDARAAYEVARLQAASATEQLSAAAPKIANVTRCKAAVDQAEQRLYDAERESHAQEDEATALETAAKVELPELPDTSALEAERQGLAEEMKEYDLAVMRREQAQENLGRAEKELERADGRMKAHAEAVFSEPDDTCPTCHQSIAGEAKALVDAARETEANELLKAVQQAASQVKELAATYKAVTVPPFDRQATTARIAAIDSEREAARSLAARHQERDAARARLAGKMEAVAASARVLADRRKELDGARDELLRAEQAASGVDIADLKEREQTAVRAEQAAAARLAELRREEATLTERLSRLEAVAERKRAACATLETGAREASDLELLVKAYGKSGIPARILDVAVTVIEEEANEYLSRFASGMSLSMTTQRENKGGGIRETLDILVTDGMGTRALERMSGGETTRANFALAVGLSRFLARQQGHVESFVVDEPEYLDTRGMAELVSCLHALSGDVPLVLVVSHLESITESLPQRLTVKRGSNGSVVQL